MKFRLRTQLFVTITLVTAVPVLWLGLSAARTQADKSLADDVSNGLATARSVAREATKIIEQFTESVETLAAHSALLVPWEPARLQEHLDACGNNIDGFSFMYIAGADGVSLAAWPEKNRKGESNVGVDYSRRDYFIDAKKTKHPQLSKVQIGKRTDVPNIQIGAPILDQAGDFLGLAEGSVDLGTLQSLMRSITRNLAYTRICIIDEEGLLVADSRTETIKSLRSAAAGFQPPESESEYRVASDDEGVLHRATLVKAEVQGQPWTVVVMRPDSIVVAAAQRARTQALKAVVFASLIALLAAALLASILSAPIASLALVANDVRKGMKPRAFPRIQAWHPSELEGLAVALSQMLESVQAQAQHLEQRVEERTHELNIASQRLAMLAVAVEHAAEAMEITGPEGSIQYVNPAFTRTTGFTLEDLRDTGVSCIGYGSKEESIQELLQDSESWSGTRVARKKDGQVYDEELTVSALRDRTTREVDFYVCIRRDVTERKRAEAELRRKELAVLQSANDKLICAAKTQDEFLSTMSHELRTPLNAILGVSEVLETGTYGELNAKQQDGIRTISNSGQHLLSLITDVLDLKKNEAGYGAIDTRPLSCEDVGLASMALVRDTTKEKQVAFEMIVSEATAWVRADERYLKQILVNLLGNAVKFTPDGGSVTLDIRASADTTMVDFIVSDTGIGISEEDLQRVFLPFVQVDSALSRNYGGTGLGLALVSRFVDLLHGRILVESELGKGSQFTVSIPRAEPPADETAQSQDEPPKIMTVEIQDEMTRMFAQLGARVDHQSTGGNALENVEAVLPDVIAINSPLPDMSSLELMQRLKECPSTRQTPLVFATSDDVGAASPQTIADILLTKPLAVQSVRSALQQLMARPTAKTPATGTQTGLVLIVEDNPANIPHLRDFLVFKGHAVEIATSGQAGIEMAQSLKPDIVLMDIQMPGMSGLTAIEEIRRDSDLDHVKVVAVTAHAMAEDRRRCMEAGANGYIAKPYQLSSLYEVISGWFGPGA